VMRRSPSLRHPGGECGWPRSEWGHVDGRRGGGLRDEAPSRRPDGRPGDPPLRAAAAPPRRPPPRSREGYHARPAAPGESQAGGDVPRGRRRRHGARAADRTGTASAPGRASLPPASLRRTRARALGRGRESVHGSRRQTQSQLLQSEMKSFKNHTKVVHRLGRGHTELVHGGLSSTAVPSPYMGRANGAPQPRASGRLPPGWRSSGRRGIPLELCSLQCEGPGGSRGRAAPSTPGGVELVRVSWPLRGGLRALPASRASAAR